MSVSLAEKDQIDGLAMPMTVRLRPVINLTEDQFYDLAQANRDLQLELTQEGELIMMPPAGGGSGRRNAEITIQLGVWAKQDKTGVTFDSSTGFRLPNGAIRSPDAAWVRARRLEPLTKQQLEKYPPLCPDFVIELRSPSDNLKAQRDKMDEYLANGAELGWLLDPVARRVFVYQAGQEMREVTGADTISADPVLPGFVLDLSDIWQ